MKRWSWALVAVVTVAVWAATLRYDWAITWDDGLMFTANPRIRAWSWWWMATTRYYGHWMPLTWLSATVNYHLWGLNPAAWHAVNVGLHTISAVLLYFIARRLVGSELGAIVAALLWAVHPLRMESVAWITERKDVLMGAFFLLAALLWLQGRRWWSFAVFFGACMCKIPAITLPVMLLALEWMRDRPHWRIHLRRLLPFFAVTPVLIVSGFLSLATQYGSLPWSIHPLGSRLLQVFYSEVFYARQMVWPSRLSALIEWTWRPSWDQPQYPIAVGVVLLGCGLLLSTHRRWPALTAAAVAYTVAVFPQSGIFQNGPQLVANRYSYLACLPLALLAGGAVTWGARRWPRMTWATSVAVVAALIVTTEVALPMWKDGDAVWQYAALHEPTCTQCQDLASAADYRHGDLAAALRHQRQAILVSDTTSHPRYERHWNLAALLLQMGRPDEARRELLVYLAAVPEHPGPADQAHILRAHLALRDLKEGS